MSAAQPLPQVEPSPPAEPEDEPGRWWDPLCLLAAGGFGLATLGHFVLAELWIEAVRSGRPTLLDPDGTGAQALLLCLGVAAAVAVAIALFHEGRLAGS